MNVPAEVNDFAIKMLEIQTGLTSKQATEVWRKSLNFNKLLIEKYGDTYLENAEKCIALNKKYQDLLINQSKNNVN
tara:strand:+ start:260 stop:487 length:228 start_codon:yes stop_codon:yes gene_type:complete